MFTLFSDQWGRNCEGIHRRELLRVGSLGMAGLTLSNWSRAKAQSPTGFVRDKSIVIRSPDIVAVIDVHAVVGELIGSSISWVVEKLIAKHHLFFLVAICYIKIAIFSKSI